jgi:hypothetical protein
MTIRSAAWSTGRAFLRFATTTLAPGREGPMPEPPALDPLARFLYG